MSKHPVPFLLLSSLLALAGANRLQAQQALYKTSGDELSPVDHGRAVAAAGDLNADGTPDFHMGAPNHHGVPGLTGRVYACSGRDGSTIRVLYGRDAEERFGASVLGELELDADGVPDVLVGVPRATAGAKRSGAVRAFSGATGRLLYESTVGAAEARFGEALAAVGDVNFDGVQDFAVVLGDAGAANVVTHLQ